MHRLDPCTLIVITCPWAPTTVLCSSSLGTEHPEVPITQTIAGGTPITGIRGDDRRVSVAGLRLWIRRVYTKGAALSLAATPISKTYLGTVRIFEGKIYVTVGQAGMAVDHDWLYLSELNEGDIALEIDKVTLRIARAWQGHILPRSARLCS